MYNNKLLLGCVAVNRRPAKAMGKLYNAQPYTACMAWWNRFVRVQQSSMQGWIKSWKKACCPGSESSSAPAIWWQASYSFYCMPLLLASMCQPANVPYSLSWMSVFRWLICTQITIKSWSCIDIVHLASSYVLTRNNCMQTDTCTGIHRHVYACATGCSKLSHV